MQSKSFALDPRYFQLGFQAFFLGYGLFFLGWGADWSRYATITGACLFFSYSAGCLRQKKWLPFRGPAGWRSWGLSILISALGLCLLLKTNHWWTAALAGLLTVASKYFFRFGKRHIFNPSAFGIAATILLTKDAWLSPGQWGNYALLFFLIMTLGAIVVTSVQKLDTSLAFLLTYMGFLFWRQVLVLGWPIDYFIHSISTGSLLLFSFFMISDPKTSPDHPVARVIWAAAIAVVSFYLSAFQFKYNTPVWMLVAFAPSVPVLNAIFSRQPFDWADIAFQRLFWKKQKNNYMRAIFRKTAAVLILIAMISNQAMAFCGFYVSKADGTLKNKTSQVIIVHDGDRNVITMFNDFKGDPKDFAMVVPVPVVLQKSDIKVVDQQVFNTLNAYSQPRLVEYYDENPCQLMLNDVVVQGYGMMKDKRAMASAEAKEERSLGVKIEAKYLIGEYDILILSAQQSAGLQTWLIQNGYKIPPGAEEVLEPYIRSNLKFFVVKVNEDERKKLRTNFLRPIQISFHSPKFMLPIRLGMANADGDQDLLVYAFSRKGRIECANYRTVSLPTARKVPLFVKDNFQNFYTNLFQYQWTGEGRSVAMLEYAWDVSPHNYFKCDPCIATVPTRQDLVQAGVWWVNDSEEGDAGNVFFTRLHVRYNRQAFPQDLQFEETANTENFQARYIITHPATGQFDCPEGKAYLQGLKERRQEELDALKFLTGKDISDWDLVDNTQEDKDLPATCSYRSIAAQENLAAARKAKNREGKAVLLATLGLMGLICVGRLKRNLPTK